MVGNKAQKAVAAALTGMLAMGAVTPAFAGVKINDNWVRLDGSYLSSKAYDEVKSGAISGTKTIDGEDRYDTMLDTIIYNVENGKWIDGKAENGHFEVVLASGTSYADSLAAAGLAGVLNNKNGAPIITTKQGELVEEAATAIEYLSQKTGLEIDVMVVGGTAAIDDAVLEAVEDLKDNDDIVVKGQKAAKTQKVTAFRKFAGTDRTDTSLKIAEFMKDKLLQFGTYDKVYLAYGFNWADALAVSSFAYQAHRPILLTGSDGLLTADQLAFVEDAISDGIEINVIGGPAEDAAGQIEAAYSTSTVNRVVGGDRYETSAKVIAASGASVGFSGYGDAKPIAVATGTNFADALVGGAFIGENEGALVLVGDEKDAALNAAIKAGYGKNNAENYILGGKNAISDNLASWVIKYIG